MLLLRVLFEAIALGPDLFQNGRGREGPRFPDVSVGEIDGHVDQSFRLRGGFAGLHERLRRCNFEPVQTYVAFREKANAEGREEAYLATPAPCCQTGSNFPCKRRAGIVDQRSLGHTFVLWHQISFGEDGKKMACTIVVGGQYGSEGKGKVVALTALGLDAPYVVRCGGPNSGHTVWIRGEEIVLRQVPSGILNPRAVLLLAA